VAHPPIRRDALVVIDVEATCWPDNHPPPGEQSEIIEIGACLLNLDTLDIEAARSLLVRPERSEVSAFCTRLTTLTQAMVNGGMWFYEACAVLARDYRAGSRAWASWGNYDRKLFEWQCAERRIAYPFAAHHLNAKTRFAELHGIRPVGMAGALGIAGLPLEGTHHRGIDDVQNIARLIASLVRRHGRDALIDAC
jgi:inhibitor of KinA sporulation pathway (predicted exonuclease)